MYKQTEDDASFYIIYMYVFCTIRCLLVYDDSFYVLMHLGPISIVTITLLFLGENLKKAKT